jgi:non-ribosomal peptide synthetase component F
LTAEVLETKLNYWRRWLAPGEPPILQLPIHKPPSSSMSFGTNESFQIPAELTQKLKIFSQNQKTTLFMTALAAFTTLLYSYSGCEDIVVRAPHDNRNHWKLESLIGVISNVMMLRIDIGGNPSFSELLMRVRQVMREAVANQDVPFEQFAKDIQVQSSNSVFKAVVTVLPESPEEEFKLPGLDVTFLEMEEFELRPDLELAIWENKTSSETFIEGWWQYKKDLFAGETITEMTNKLLRLLEAIVTKPEDSVKQIHEIL